MSKDERVPMVRDIHAEKVVVVHTLNGDLRIGESLLDERKAFRARQWRPLAKLSYQTGTQDEDLGRHFMRLLYVHLHRAFRDRPYTHFTSLIGAGHDDSGRHVVSFAITTQYAEYVGAIRATLGAFQGVDAAAVNAQWKADQAHLASWRIERALEYPTDRTLLGQPTAHEFVYDASARRISIEPKQGSVVAEEYPDHLRTTSEVLEWLSRISSAPFGALDRKTGESSYPLFKLVLALLDRKAAYEDLRVAVDDPETWDYHYPVADAKLPS